MRKLVNLEGNIVPTNKAYKEALKGMTKYTVICFGAYCAYWFVVGVLQEARSLSEQKAYTKHD